MRTYEYRKQYRCDECGRKMISLFWIPEIDKELCDDCYKKRKRRVKKIMKRGGERLNSDSHREVPTVEETTREQ